MSRGIATFAVAASLVLGGCTVVVPGDPVGAQQSHNSPKPLPFTPTIKDRTNDRTDGTSFEPCNAYSNAELAALEINPDSIEDAAKVDAANYRGCHWRGIDYTIRHGGTRYSQIVGREMTLEQYKRYMASLRWQTDRTVHGRTLAVAAENDNCLAVFRSAESIVATIVATTNTSPGNTVECERAVAFASLAISKAP
ncbi:DUF3558 domain-containing protein [Tsukamurella sp. NPDC003166]|uniref:DUF3558 domain-containing protein n=1 Tax=Tsukamurella sp. NPDC003166 TaxID=3154444 RepID=UPI0033AFF6FD